jgi:Fe-S cluster assembly ATP-binding protein
MHQNGDKSMLLITHYKRLLEYIRPDKVHVMVQGKIVASGDFHLVDELEKKGYESFVC